MSKEILCFLLFALLPAHQCLSCSEWNCTESGWICDDILAAGEVRGEKERYELLVDLRNKLDNHTELAEELSTLLPVVDRWANGLEKYWSSDSDQVTGEKEHY